MKDLASRELRISATLPSAIDQLWNAWTEPDQVAQWWGPAGFTTTIHKMDFVEGGEWNLTLQGPDGKNFPNRAVFLEIIPLEKISFEHFNPHFITTVVFTGAGKESTLEWTLLFDTEEMRDIIVTAHKADEGQKQNIGKLRAFLGSGNEHHQN